MCGLVGIARMQDTGLFKSHVEAFNTMLIADSVRGSDSTGIFGIDKKNHLRVCKQLGDPYNLMSTNDYWKIADSVTQPYRKILAGHNRFATKGKVTAENAHPFREEHICLMHNGTLSDYDLLSKKDDVDSRSLTHSIKEIGIAETVSKIQGAYAVVYADMKARTLNFARNSQRPLFMAVNETDECLAWASEIGLLRWALSRHGLASKEKEMEFFELPADSLYTYSFSSVKVVKTPLPYTGSNMYKYTSKSSHTHSSSNQWEWDDETSQCIPYELKKYVPPATIPILTVVKSALKEEPGPRSGNVVLKSLKSKSATPYVLERGTNVLFNPYNTEAKGKDGSVILIGKRGDFHENVIFKVAVPNQKMADQLLDAEWIPAVVKNMAFLQGKTPAKDRTVVWCNLEDVKNSPLIALH